MSGKVTPSVTVQEICHSEYPIARGALIEPRKNREVACAVRTTDLFMSSRSNAEAKNLMCKRDPSLVLRVTTRGRSVSPVF